MKHSEALARRIDKISIADLTSELDTYGCATIKGLLLLTNAMRPKTSMRMTVFSASISIWHGTGLAKENTSIFLIRYPNLWRSCARVFIQN